MRQPQPLPAMMMVHPVLFSLLVQLLRVHPSPRTGTSSGLTPTAPWYAFLLSRRSSQPLTTILHPPSIQLTYLAQCPGSTCTGVNANSLKWFKIDEVGKKSDGSTWVQQDISTFPFTSFHALRSCSSFYQ